MFFRERKGLWRIAWRAFFGRRYSPTSSTDGFYLTLRWKLTRVVSFFLYGTRCLVCGTFGHPKHNPMTADHLIPLSWFSGQFFKHNPLYIVPKCWDCNARKGARFADDPRPKWAKTWFPVKLVRGAGRRS